MYVFVLGGFNVRLSAWDFTLGVRVDKNKWCGKPLDQYILERTEIKNQCVKRKRSAEEELILSLKLFYKKRGKKIWKRVLRLFGVSGD